MIDIMLLLFYLIGLLGVFLLGYMHGYDAAATNAKERTQ